MSTRCTSAETASPAARQPRRLTKSARARDCASPQLSATPTTTRLPENGRHDGKSGRATGGRARGNGKPRAPIPSEPKGDPSALAHIADDAKVVLVVEDNPINQKVHVFGAKAPTLRFRQTLLLPFPRAFISCANCSLIMRTRAHK